MKNVDQSIRKPSGGVLLLLSTSFHVEDFAGILSIITTIGQFQSWQVWHQPKKKLERTNCQNQSNESHLRKQSRNDFHFFRESLNDQRKFFFSPYILLYLSRSICRTEGRVSLSASTRSWSVIATSNVVVAVVVVVVAVEVTPAWKKDEVMK